MFLRHAWLWTGTHPGVLAVDSVTPNHGPAGTHVVVAGSGFTHPGLHASLNLTAVDGFVVNNDGELVFDVPDLGIGAGTYDLAISYGGGPGQTIHTSFGYEIGAWTPLADAAITSGLYLPGGYATAGTPGVNETAQWTDASGHGRHFVYNASIFPGGVTAPVSHARGYPIFDGVAGALECTGKSFNGDFTTPNNGAIVVIAQVRNRLGPHNVLNQPFVETGLVMGSGAEPGIVVSDAGVSMEGSDAIDFIEASTASFRAYASTLIAGKWDSIGVYSAAGGDTWGAVTPYHAGETSLSGINMGSDSFIGANTSNEVVRGVIKAVAFYPNAADVDAAKLAQWQAWAVAQGLVSAWSPRDDAAVTMLLMPGSYNPDGSSPGVGKWSDSSFAGYGNDVVQVTGGAGILDEFGCPAFAGSDHLQIAKGLGTDFAAPNNGTIVVISKQPSLPTFDGTYYNTPATITGSGATPQLSQDDTGAFISGYDAIDYVAAQALSGVAAAGTPHIQFGAWDGAGMYAACDENAFSAVAPYHAGQTSLSAANIGAVTYVGRSYGGFFTGTEYAVAIYPAKQPDAKVAQWRAWATLEELV